MKYLITSLLGCVFFLQLQACETSDCSRTESDSFKFNMTHGLSLRSFTLNSDIESDNGTATRRAYNNRTETDYRGLSVFTDIDLYSITSALSKLHNVSLNYEDKETHLQSGYQINSLYLSLDLTDNITLYHGSMPFKGGRFSEIKDPTVNGGNGLAVINNQVYSSNFVSYHDNTEDGKYSIIIGEAEFNTKNNYNGLQAKNEGSDGTYVISSYETGKNFFEADIYDMNVKFHDLDYAHLQIAGAGYIYDDSIYSGWTAYSNLAVSNISEDIVGLMTQYGITSTDEINYYRDVKHANVDNISNVKGYAGLFGVNYEFDALNKSFNIGSEVFITRGGWVSANHGVAFNSDHSWYANRNAIESTIYAGCNLTQNLRVSSKFVQTESKQVPNAFGLSLDSDQDSAFEGGSFARRFQKVEFLINYNF